MIVSRFVHRLAAGLSAAALVVGGAVAGTAMVASAQTASPQTTLTTETTPATGPSETTTPTTSDSSTSSSTTPPNTTTPSTSKPSTTKPTTPRSSTSSTSPRTTASSTSPSSTPRSTSASTTTPRPAVTIPSAPGSSPTTDPFTYTRPTRPSEPPAALSGRTLAEQVARAEELRQQLLNVDRDLALELSKLQRLSKTANRSLQEFADAKRKERTATREAREAKRELKKSKQRLQRSRDDLARWAADVYTHGAYAEQLAWVDALSVDPSGVTNPMGDLTFLSDSRARALDLLREETSTQAEASRRAADKHRQAQKHYARAEKARKDATAVITEQRAVVAKMRTENAKAIKAAGPIVSSLVGMTHPDAKSARAALVAALKESGVDAADFDEKACSTDETEYPNGQIPPRALCPLIAGNGNLARPSAAAAFNAMSKAYAKETGHLLCVTDGYRSYAQQVAVKASRGSWAATPGRSNHGFGIAVDLCGGVNDFGHPAHLWMLANAPLYGWYHPDWAAADGSLPEPWHWEFAG